MRRSAAAWMLALAITLPGVVRAQVDAEEVRRLTGTTEALLEGQESMRRQIQELRELVIQLRGENAQLKADLSNRRDIVTQDQLRQVVDQLKEVDRKRVADADYVRNQLSALAKEVNQSLAVPREPPRPRTPEPAAPSAAPEEFYEHKVQAGETLSAILTAYRRETGTKATQAQVLAANPSVKDPTLIRVGQVLRIPAIK